MPPLDWRTLFENASRVMRLVHLAARGDSVDVEEWRGRLLRMSREAYDDELAVQAAKVGCKGRYGRLGNNEILSDINARCEEWAGGIVNTYNYYLAGAIANIRSEVPTANRHVYASRLRTWEEHYWSWKLPQIVEYTTGRARARAQQDFYRFNASLIGHATLQPRTAVCPVCKGWIARGKVPLRVALNNPPPYHPSCPHYWYTSPQKVNERDCANLWMGE